MMAGPSFRGRPPENALPAAPRRSIKSTTCGLDAGHLALAWAARHASPAGGAIKLRPVKWGYIACQ
jgi:hypothetical protein